MGAYDNPRVPIVDYSLLTKNMMQQFMFWNQLWEKRRQANQKNAKNAEDLELQRLQGTFIAPTQELGVEYTNQMTHLFRDMIDARTWAGANAGQRNTMLERVKTEAAGAKMISQVMDWNLSEIDKGENPDLYGLVNAVKGLKAGNKSNFRMTKGRYYGGSENRSENEKFMYVPGQIGLGYTYTNENGDNVYYNADELQSVLGSLRNAKELYNDEYEKEINAMGENIHKEGSSFNTKWHRQSKATQESFIENGGAYSATEEGTGFNYESNARAAALAWVKDKDNYDLAAGIYRNYIPGVESHIFKPTASQLNEMAQNGGKYMLDKFGQGAFKEYMDYFSESVDTDGDGNVSEAEATALGNAQEELLAKKIEEDIWGSKEISKVPVITPEPEVEEGECVNGKNTVTGLPCESDDEFDGIRVGDVEIADAGQDDLDHARRQLRLIETEFNAVSSRTAGAEDIKNNPGFLLDSPEFLKIEDLYNSEDAETPMPSYWVNAAVKEKDWVMKQVTAIAAKDAKERTAFENKVYKLYETSVQNYDPDINKLATRSANLIDKGWSESRIDPVNKTLTLYHKTYDKKEGGEGTSLTFDLKDPDRVRALYDLMTGATKTQQTMYGSLFKALYGVEFFSEK
jgi:hypothetical protein